MCDLHRVQGMTGKVTVIAGPGRDADAHAAPDQDRDADAAAATATPDHSRDTPAPTGEAAADKTAPVVSKRQRAGVRRDRRARQVDAVGGRDADGHSSAEAASRAIVRTVRLYGPPGTSALTVRGGELKRGSYFVSVEARDAAGNRSATHAHDREDRPMKRDVPSPGRRLVAPRLHAQRVVLDRAGVHVRGARRR